MKTEIRIPRYIGLLLVFHEALAAQPFFYHAGQDKNAQLAASTAKEIANGALFDNEVQHPAALSKVEIERVLSFAQEQFRAGVAAFNTWKAVSDQLKRIDLRLRPTGMILTETEANQRIAEVEKQVAALRRTIEKLSQAAGGSSDIVKEIQGPLKGFGAPRSRSRRCDRLSRCGAQQTGQRCPDRQHGKYRSHAGALGQHRAHR